MKAGVLFLFFHKRLCGPLANSRFHHRPDRNTVQTAGSKPPITAPTPPSNASSISWLQLDRPGASMIGATGWWSEMDFEPEISLAVLPNAQSELPFG